MTSYVSGVVSILVINLLVGFISGSSADRVLALAGFVIGVGIVILILMKVDPGDWGDSRRPLVLYFSGVLVAAVFLIWSPDFGSTDSSAIAATLNHATNEVSQ